MGERMPNSWRRIVASTFSASAAEPISSAQRAVTYAWWS
jgi:hypothetical protein